MDIALNAWHKGQRLHLLTVLVLASYTIPKTNAYQCVCNYKEENEVYESPDTSSNVICYIAKDDCLYYSIRQSVFQPLPVEALKIAQVGYVVEDDGYLSYGTCPGNIADGDGCHVGNSSTEAPSTTLSVSPSSASSTSLVASPTTTVSSLKPRTTTSTTSIIASSTSSVASPTTTVSSLKPRTTASTTSIIASSTSSVASPTTTVSSLKPRTTASTTSIIASSTSRTTASSASPVVSFSLSTTAVTFSTSTTEESTAVFCDTNEDYRGIIWQRSPPMDVILPCFYVTDNSDFDGEVSRECTSEGIWNSPFYSCISKNLQAVKGEVDDLLDNPNEEKMLGVLEKLSNITTIELSHTTLFEGELLNVTSMLESIATISNNLTVYKEQSLAFINISGNLLDNRNQKPWQTITERESDQADDTRNDAGAARVLHAVEAYLEAIVNTLGTNETSRTIEQRNIVVDVAILSENDTEDIKFPRNTFEGFQTKSSIFIDDDTVKANGLWSFAGVMYKNLTDVMPSTYANEKSTSRSTKHRIINSVVLALTVNGLTPSHDIPVTINLEHFQKSLSNPVCSFWNYSTNVWDSNGCYPKTTNSSMTVCRCSHLTNFAILMSPWTKVNTVAKTIDIISTVGCSISLVGLLATVGVHLFLWSYMKTDKVILLLNLAVALIVSYLLFLFGVDRTDDKIVCTAIAVALHYIYLAVFFLMLVEGITMATSVLVVFYSKPRLKRKLLAAWGLPLVIVSISAGITKFKGYATEKHCWLSNEDGFIWAFVGPAACIVLVNTVLLCIILKIMLGTKTLQQRRIIDKIKASVRGMCILMPLMGCTWIFGMLYVNEDFAWVQYAFAICNSLQGLVIFVFQVILNEQIHTAFQKRRRKYINSEQTLSLQAKLSNSLNGR